MTIKSTEVLKRATDAF